MNKRTIYRFKGIHTFVETKIPARIKLLRSWTALHLRYIDQSPLYKMSAYCFLVLYHSPRSRSTISTCQTKLTKLTKCTIKWRMWNMINTSFSGQTAFVGRRDLVLLLYAVPKYSVKWKPPSSINSSFFTSLRTTRVTKKKQNSINIYQYPMGNIGRWKA